MAVTKELLSTFPLLAPVPQAALEDLAQVAMLQKFARREIVLKAGEEQEHLCFLFEGRLQGVDFTIDGREVGLFFVEPGDFCGELPLFDSGPQPEYIVALTTAVVVKIPLVNFREIMTKTPEVLSNLSSKLAEKLREMAHQRTLLGLPNVSQRVCCQLWLLVPHNENEGENDESDTCAITNPPTHLEIAIMLNVSRETVTRVFQKLQNQKLVQRAGPTRLMVKNPKALKQLAEGLLEL
ncbi:MAG: cyclic nucleotide-binding domain-containing protein [Pseudomonadales bacterium]|nr:cyclic nucleotide-binding domain-containing protein [Pseudomonadales bacterium]